MKKLIDNFNLFYFNILTNILLKKFIICNYIISFR